MVWIACTNDLLSWSGCSTTLSLAPYTNIADTVGGGKLHIKMVATDYMAEANASLGM